MNTLYFNYNAKANYCVSLSFNVSENSDVMFDLKVSDRQRKTLMEKIRSSAAEDVIYSLCEEAESRLDDEELEYVKDQCPGWDVVYDKVFDAVSCYAQEERRKERFGRASCKDILRAAKRKKACYSIRHRGRRARLKSQSRSHSSFVAASSLVGADSGDDDGDGSDDGDGGSGEGDCHSSVKNVGQLNIRAKKASVAARSTATVIVAFFRTFGRQEATA